jgi:preprotein translocase subunit SecG
MPAPPIVPAAATPAAQPSAVATLNPATAQQLQQFTFPVAPKTPLAQHLPWLTHLFAGIFIGAALLLIILLAVQTTRQEGLTGTIGGRVESAYRGRLGIEGQIARFTAFVAIAYVVVATIISISGI